MLLIREDIRRKKLFKRASFLSPFLIVPKIGTFLLKSHHTCMCFGNFCHHYHLNHHHYYHIIITTIIVIIVLFSVICPKCCFDVQKHFTVKVRVHNSTCLVPRFAHPFRNCKPLTLSERVAIFNLASLPNTARYEKWDNIIKILLWVFFTTITNAGWVYKVISLKVSCEPIDQSEINAIP